MVKQQIGYLLILVSALAAIIGLLLLDPIHQQTDYHGFCDKRTIFSIPNFWNVISNLPFLIVGAWGLKWTLGPEKPGTQYIFFFIGIALVSIGSAYYHVNPTNTTLVFDRAPMTIAFMSLLSIITSEFFNKQAGYKLLYPLLLSGIFSVIYWVVFNDLRLYLLVQFYPILIILVALIFFNSSYKSTFGYWALLMSYVIAKLFEHFDCETQSALKMISGHSIKHLIISLGIIMLIHSFRKRI